MTTTARAPRLALRRERNANRHRDVGDVACRRELARRRIDLERDYRIRVLIFREQELEQFRAALDRCAPTL